MARGGVRTQRLLEFDERFIGDTALICAVDKVGGLVDGDEGPDESPFAQFVEITGPRFIDLQCLFSLEVCDRDECVASRGWCGSDLSPPGLAVLLPGDVETAAPSCFDSCREQAIAEMSAIKAMPYNNVVRLRTIRATFMISSFDALALTAAEAERSSPSKAALCSLGRLSREARH